MSRPLPRSLWSLRRDHPLHPGTSSPPGPTLPWWSRLVSHQLVLGGGSGSEGLVWGRDLGPWFLRCSAPCLPPRMTLSGGLVTCGSSDSPPLQGPEQHGLYPGTGRRAPVSTCVSDPRAGSCPSCSDPGGPQSPHVPVPPSPGKNRGAANSGRRCVCPSRGRTGSTRAGGGAIASPQKP